jgi:small-conductance mechanosensitive channel
MEKRLAAAGIGIPFPQRTIHLNLPEGSAVKLKN